MNRQKKESANLKIWQWKLLSLRNRKKRVKTSEQSLTDLGDTIKEPKRPMELHPIYIMKVSMKTERQRGRDNIWRYNSWKLPKFD